MTFEEDFPSLKVKYFKGSIFIDKRDVEQDCLDKKRVLDAIEKVLFGKNVVFGSLGNELKKELGLNDI